jgi:hypothetical protein
MRGNPRSSLLNDEGSGVRLAYSALTMTCHGASSISKWKPLWDGIRSRNTPVLRWPSKPGFGLKLGVV